MKKLLSLIFVMTALVAGARQISPDEAAAIASDFLNSPSIQRASGRVTVQRAQSANHQADAPFYVFNADDNHGFVIISGDDRARKILGYSDTGAFDLDNIPPQLAALLEQYAAQIEALPASASADPSWSAPSAAPATTDGVLLETANWGQGYPYNAQCPVIDGVQAPTGCVATAMAIVMKYHNWPEQGNGKHINFFNSELQFDYGCYKPKWDIMDQESNNGIYSAEQIGELSKLCLSAGIAVDMQYNAHESGADILFLGNVMSSRFNYAPTRKFRKKDFTDLEWNNIIANEIDNKRPILYYANGSAGHLFIVDGYENNDYYHINWGWDGNMNGYFSLCNLVVNELDLSDNHEMITHIEPNRSDVRYSSFIVNDGEGIFSDLKNNGFNFTVNKIKSNESFSAVLPQVYGNVGNSGLIGLAVVDSLYNIIEIVGKNAGQISPPVNYLGVDGAEHSPEYGIEQIWLFECGEYKAQKMLYAYNIHNLKFATDINPGYKLQLIGRDSPYSKWEIILGTDRMPTDVSLENEVPSVWCDIKFDYDSTLIDIIPYDDFSNGLKTVLRDGFVRYIVILGGSTNPRVESSGDFYLSDNGCNQSFFDYGTAVFLGGDENYFNIAVDEKVTDFSHIDLQPDEIEIDGIIYKVGDKKLGVFEPESYAYVIGYTGECKETTRIENNVIIDGIDYPVKAIIPGAFKDNDNLRHIDLSTSNLYFSNSAFSFLPNVETLTVNSENEPYVSIYLFHKSNRLKAVYELGDFSSNLDLNTKQVSEFLYQLLGDEWKKYGAFPEWYISSTSKLLRNPHEQFFYPGDLTEVYPPHYYVPGAFVMPYNNQLPDNVSEMWQYGVDLERYQVYVKPMIEDIVINDIIINGRKAVGNDNIYRLDAASGDQSSTNNSLDVVINYTLHGHQSMTTHYSAEFNACVESGIEDVTVDKNGEDVIYNLQGIRVQAPLTPGYYIINGEKRLVK